MKAPADPTLSRTELQLEQPIVVEGWTWGVNAEHSIEVAWRCADSQQLVKMADELLAKDVADQGKLIGRLVGNQNLPFEKAVQLAKHGRPFSGPSYYLSTRKDLTPEVLEEWMEDNMPWWSRVIRENPNIPIATLDTFTRHPHPEVVCAALLSGRLPQETIDSLAGHNEDQIKSAVGTMSRNPEILRSLAKCLHPLHCAGICRNPHTPTEIINEIGRSYVYLVEPVAYRVTDPAVLQKLCGKYGKQYEVYFAKKEMLDDESRRHWPLVIDGHRWGLTEPDSLAAAREVKDKDQITRMADDILSKRLDIARFATLGRQILNHLAVNEALPIATAKQLLKQTPDWGYDYAFIARSDVTPEMLDEFADQPGLYGLDYVLCSNKVKPETVTRIALNGEFREVCYALQSSRLPGEVLDKFATSEITEFRELVSRGTENPAILAKLTFDPVDWIRRIVVSRGLLAAEVREKVAITDNNIEVVIEATKTLTNPDVLKVVFEQLGKWPASAQLQELKDALIANPHTSELVRVVIQI